MAASAPKASAKKAKKNKRRADAPPKNFWHRRAQALRLGDEVFRSSVLSDAGRPNRYRRADISDVTTAFSWTDASAELTGSFTVAVPPKHTPITEKNKIQVEWMPAPGMKWTRLFTMQSSGPEKQLSSGSWQLDLTTNMTTVRKSKDSYRFKKGKAHPNGWTADQITKYVARKVHLPLGRVAKCTHRIKNLSAKDADPVDVITKAYRAEREATGRKFFISWDGSLNIDPLQRGQHLLMLSSVLIDATYKTTLKEGFATSVSITATAKARDKGAKKGKDRKRKIHVRVESEEGKRVYGYVHRAINIKADSAAEARKVGKRKLAELMKPKQELSVVVPLMPQVRRGDAFRVFWKSEGLSQIVFVTQAEHQVDPGSRQTTITARFDDPYVDSDRDRDAKRREAKARARKRKRGDDHAPKGATGRKAKRRVGG